MRKTFEELVEGIRRPTTHYADQDFYDTDIEALLQLVRKKTLEECSQFIIFSSHNNTEEEFNSLFKDNSIEI